LLRLLSAWSSWRKHASWTPLPAVHHDSLYLWHSSVRVTTPTSDRSAMLCNERIMGDLLDRFQMGRASYELKADEAEVIRAKFNTASNPLYNSPHPTPVQLLTHAKNATEFCAWKVSAVQYSARPAQAPKTCSALPQPLTHKCCTFRRSILPFWSTLMTSPVFSMAKDWQCFWTTTVHTFSFEQCRQAGSCYFLWTNCVLSQLQEP